MPRAWLAIALLPLVPMSAQAQSNAPLPVRVRVEAGPHYPNQLIRLQVIVVAGSTRPEVTPPTPRGARLELTGSSFRALTMSAIGEIVEERNQFLHEYRLVPERPGPLALGPFVARLGNRRGASAPQQLEIRPWPPDRPAAFLGGVGPLTVTTALVPARSVRVGEPVEYVIRLEGPGAIGTTTNPLDLKRLNALAIAPEVALIGNELIPDPPTRVWRFRVRPTRPGMAALPAVRIAWLNPRTARYQTVVGPSIELESLEVPEYDPATMDYAAPSAAALGRTIAAGGLGLSATIAVGAVLALATRRFGRARPSARRTARRLAHQFAPKAPFDSTTVAESVDAALRAYLCALMPEVPQGASTAALVRRALSALGDDRALTARVADLTMRTELVRYSGVPFDEPNRDALRRDAHSLFTLLAERPDQDRPAVL